MLNEYPRPQLVRDSYLCLNGEWEYAIRKTADLPTEFDGKILVPFSPEKVKSGVNKIVTPDDFLYYKFSLNILRFFPLFQESIFSILLQSYMMHFLRP